MVSIDPHCQCGAVKTYDFSVLVALGGATRRKWEALADGGFDGGARRRDEVTELVAGSDDESSEASGTELHEMNGDDTPGALHAELLEKCGSHDAVVADEGVGVEEQAADDADYNDAEATTEHLREVSDRGTASHGTQVSDDLRNGDLSGTEIVLVFEHGWVEIL
jgi:hypothetical protein